MSVSLVWATPEADALIAKIARVSNPANEDNPNAERLIRYLIRHKHWSPFEMADVCMEIRTTRDIGRQILRHWSFRFQEFSQRYAAVAALGEPVFREARMQDKTNRQSSLPCSNDELSGWWKDTQRDIYELASVRYELALMNGIAKEQARALLPEGLTPTRMYMKGDVRSWLHYCQLRKGNGTQKEHADIAAAAWEVLRGVVPVVVQAVEEESEG